MVYLGITPPPPGVNIATFNSQSSVDHFFQNFPNLGIFHPIFLRCSPNSISSICIHTLQESPNLSMGFPAQKEVVIFTPALPSTTVLKIHFIIIQGDHLFTRPQFATILWLKTLPNLNISVS